MKLFIQSGAGGRESKDFAKMLKRMIEKYLKKCEISYKSTPKKRKDCFGVQFRGMEPIVDSLIGVHRLVRVSPFDPLKRRHTSFCTVFEQEKDYRNYIMVATYVFQPYQMAKNLITGKETDKVATVLDGDLSIFA